MTKFCCDYPPEMRKVAIMFLRGFFALVCDSVPGIFRTGVRQCPGDIQHWCATVSRGYSALVCDSVPGIFGTGMRQCPGDIRHCRVSTQGRRLHCGITPLQNWKKSFDKCFTRFLTPSFCVISQSHL